MGRLLDVNFGWMQSCEKICYTPSNQTGTGGLSRPVARAEALILPGIH